MFLTHVFICVLLMSNSLAYGPTLSGLPIFGNFGPSNCKSVQKLQHVDLISHLTDWAFVVEGTSYVHPNLIKGKLLIIGIHGCVLFLLYTIHGG